MTPKAFCVLNHINVDEQFINNLIETSISSKDLFNKIQDTFDTDVMMSDVKNLWDTYFSQYSDP